MPLSRWDGFPVMQDRPPLFSPLGSDPPNLGGLEEARWDTLSSALFTCSAVYLGHFSGHPPTICG